MVRILMRHTTRPIIALLLVAQFVLVSVSGQQHEQPVTSGAPPYQWPRSRDYDVRHYKIAVSFDWAKKSVQGETEITLRPFRSDLREIQIDAGDMKVESVRIPAAGPLKFRYEDNEDLFISLNKTYGAGEDVKVAIKYSASPKKGLTFITPTETDPSRPYQIWSQGETELNHYWFPCYDYPNDRATSEVIATVESRYQVISNGDLVGVREGPAQNTKTWHWKLDKPFPSYLVSIIVGEFSEVRDSYKSIPIVSYVYRGQEENARLSYGKTARMADFFAKKLELDYPYTRYSQTTVHDFSGGMENITATTLSHLLLYDKRALLDVSADELIAHELVHQWFGNLITCREWAELWLNEAFATYFANLWTEHDKGKDEYFYEMASNHQTYFDAWNRGLRHPVLIRRFHDPEELFDPYPYQRGAAVLGMLHFILGDESFWKAVKHYVQKHQWDVVETPELIIAIEEATGQNLAWFFDEWVYKMGHPEFELKSEYDEAGKTLKLTVKQTQKPDETKPWFESPAFFITPVDVAITTSTGEKVHRVWIDAKEEEFKFKVDGKPLIVNFDRGNRIIKRVRFNRTDEQIGYQLLHDSDVTGRIRAALELRQHRTDAAASALAESLRKEPFWGVRLEAVNSLAEFKSAGAKQALISASSDRDSRVRRAAIKGLGVFKDAALGDLFTRFIKTDPSYFVVSEAARSLGMTGGAKAFDVLAELLKQDSWQEILKAGALGGFSELKDPRALDFALQNTKIGASPFLRGPAIQLLGDAGKGDERAFDALTKLLRDESLQTVLLAAQALEKLGDPRAIPPLEEAARRADMPVPGKQILAGIIDKLKKQPAQR